MSDRVYQLELCTWLRDNSSGVYRKSAEGADEIERLQQELDDTGEQMLETIGVLEDVLEMETLSEDGVFAISSQLDMLKKLLDEKAK